jgi:hypothetical protein
MEYVTSMIHKNMQKKYMMLMIGIMLIAMLFFFIILGEDAATSMLAGPMILVMVLMIAFYLLAMLILMKPKKGHHIHKMICVKCGKELSPGNLICPFCGHENDMDDFHEKHMRSDTKKNPKKR